MLPRHLLVLAVTTATLAAATGLALPLPMTAAVNGDFEAGLAGWTIPSPGVIQVVSPGGGAVGKVLSVPALVPSPSTNGNWAFQPIATPDVPYLAYQVSARVASGPGRPGVQTGGAVSNWNPTAGCLAGGCQFQASIALSQSTVRMSILGGPASAAPLPSLDAWHNYTVLYAPGVAVGVFLIDGVPALPVGAPAGLPTPPLVLGQPGAYPAAQFIYQGDGAQAAGRAPDVQWDNVYFGPALDLPV